MRNVLADLAIESEAATASAMRVARSYDEDDPAFRRFATAVMKYWVSKRAAPHAAEALECLGGNGFVEDSGLPVLYRDAPLNSIWEGSGNVAALDVLRAMVKEPEGLPAFLAECELAARRRRASGRPSASACASAPARCSPAATRQFQARRVVEDLAVALQASLLVRHAPPGGRRRVLRRQARRRGRARVRHASGRRRRGGDHRPRAAGVSIVEVQHTGRVARITLNRPERGNGITRALLTELEAAVERADLDPAVHVILLSGTGKGFCGGYDLVQSAEGSIGPTESAAAARIAP